MVYDVVSSSPTLEGVVVPGGRTESGFPVVHPITYHTDKTTQILGLKFRAFSDTIVDTVSSMVDKGLVKSTKSGFA